MRTSFHAIYLALLSCVTTAYSQWPEFGLAIEREAFPAVRITIIGLDPSTDFVELQSSDFLDGPWQGLPYPPTVINGQYVFHVPIGPSDEFFRGSLLSANVYSTNLVGYMTLVLPAGTNALAIPLISPALTVESLTVPEMTCVNKTNGMRSCFEFGGWDEPGLTLEPGERFMLETPSAVNLTVVGQVPEVPIIAIDPMSQFARLGTNVYMRAIAVGMPPLAFYWRKGSATVLEGAFYTLNISLFLSGVGPTNAGTYSVTVTNDFGVTSSLPAELVVTPKMLPNTNGPDGSFHCPVLVSSGVSYVLEASRYLTNDWSVVSVGTATNGEIVLKDTLSHMFPHRFYRVREVAP
jgi:hypothetical protein